MSQLERIEVAAAIAGDHRPEGIAISPAERAARVFDAATLDRAETLFLENG